MNILVTIYYNVGGSVAEGEKLQSQLTTIASKYELSADTDNFKRLLSHCYFSDTIRTTKKKAELFAKEVRKIKNIDRVHVAVN